MKISMSHTFDQEVNSLGSMLNPKNGFIVGDILGIIEPMSLFPEKTLENWTIFLSNKDLTPYKEKFEEDFLNVTANIFGRTWRYKKIREVVDGEEVCDFTFDGEHVCDFSFEVFHSSCRMIYHGLDFYGFSEYIKGIGLEIIKVEKTLELYKGKLGRNVDVSHRPMLNFCHGCNYVIKEGYMSMTCSQIYFSMFVDGRYTIAVIDKGFDILGFVRYLHGNF